MPKGQAMKYFTIHLAACVAVAAETVLYQAAVIHTADRGAIENGQMLVQGDRITALGKMVQVPRNARTVNLGKLQLYPGLIAAFNEKGKPLLFLFFKILISLPKLLIIFKELSVLPSSITITS